MQRRSRTQITIETHEVTVIRRPAGSAPARCPVCRPGGWMLRPEAAGAVAGVSTRTIYALVEAGRLHFTEAADAGLRVCLRSLLASAG